MTASRWNKLHVIERKDLPSRPRSNANAKDKNTEMQISRKIQMVQKQNQECYFN